MPASHLFDLLFNPEQVPSSGLFILIGTDYFLQQQAIDTILAKASPEGSDNVRWFSDSAEWAEVIDEVSTASLFGGDGMQVAVVPAVNKRVNNKESFLSTNKERLERYAAAEYHPGVMVLISESALGNLGLAKTLNKENRVFDCRIPNASSWKKEDKAIREKAVKWVAVWAQKAHNLKLNKEASIRLMELSHDNAGIVEMNLLKLELLVDQGATVSPEQITEFVGGWEQKNTFEVVDDALGGSSSKALQRLDNLLRDGDAPQQIFGGMSYAYRRFVRMTRNMQKYRRQGVGGRQAAEQCILDEFGERAGHFKKKEILPQLKQLTSERINFFMQWLLEADLDLKNRFSKSTIPMEKLLIYLDRGFKPENSSGGR